MYHGQRYRNRDLYRLLINNIWEIHKRTLTPPGHLRSPCLTFPPVGPLPMTSGGSTESHQDLSFDTPAASGAKPPPRPTAVASPKIQKSPPNAVDTLDTAIDFVLTLEHPCMAHIPYPAEPGGEDPANHMMLVCVPRYDDYDHKTVHHCMFPSPHESLFHITLEHVSPNTSSQETNVSFLNRHRRHLWPKRHRNLRNTRTPNGRSPAVSSKSS